MARVGAETAAKRGRWDAWVSILVLSAIAGTIFFKRRRSFGKKSALWVALSSAAALVAILSVQRFNPFGWSLGFTFLARTALTVAVFLGAASVAVLLFSFAWDGIRKRRSTSAPVKPVAPPEDGNSREKIRGEAQREDWRYCSRCGALVFQMDDVRFCHNCGAPIPGKNPKKADSAARRGSS